MEPPPDDPPDDASIANETEVLRRVPPDEFKRNGLPNSNNFDLDGSGNGTSVVLWLEAEADLKRVRLGHEEYGVVALAVGAWREQGLTITRHELPGNPNHCEIWGARSTSTKRKLAKAARWICYPADYPDDLKMTG